MTTPVVVETISPKSQAPEARSGLDPWRIDELPPAPTPRGLGWFSAIGPGVIALGVSIGSGEFLLGPAALDRKSTRLNSSHSQISYAVFCLKKKKKRKNGIGTCRQ